MDKIIFLFSDKCDPQNIRKHKIIEFTSSISIFSVNLDQKKSGPKSTDSRTLSARPAGRPEPIISHFDRSVTLSALQKFSSLILRTDHSDKRSHTNTNMSLTQTSQLLASILTKKN